MKKYGLLSKDIFGAYITNKSYYCGKFDLSYVQCNTSIFPDYLCLYSELKNYHRTKKTCICFYEYDEKYDGFNGLYNAIIFQRKERLNEYKKRFSGINFFISPDYSMFGDMPIWLQIFNLEKSRIVSIWLTLELSAIVIPNITFSNENSFDYCFDGIAKESVVAISLKGSSNPGQNHDLTIKAIKQTVDIIKPRAIIVYSVAKDEATTFMVKYAIEKGVRIVIPSNQLNERNQALRGYSHGS